MPSPGYLCVGAAESLLKAGADPKTTLPRGETALMTASRTGKVEAVIRERLEAS